MEPPMPNAIGSSIVMESCISGQTPAPAPASKNAYALEISLISAQDLAPISKSMQPYAATWIYPNRKHLTQVDQQGHKNPKWNEKFTFRLKDDLPEDAAVTVEIYTLSWFRDVLLGTVNVPIKDLVEPLAQSPSNDNKNTRFVTLQVKSPSGTPQGILNIGVALRDSATANKSTPLHQSPPAKHLQPQHVNEHPIDDHKMELISKIEMWRSMSSTSPGLRDDDFTMKPGSIVNGSILENGSELCSDIGPSASIVAAEMAMKLMPPPPPQARKGARAADDSSSILGDMTLEQAQAKGYNIGGKERMRKAAMAINDSDDSEVSVKNPKRGGDGSLFSCFAAGIEFTIVCGASKKPGTKKPNSRKK